MPRRIVHLTATAVDRMGYMNEEYREPDMGFACLCDDGSAWELMPGENEWKQLPSVPTRAERIAAVKKQRAEYDAEHADVTTLPLADCECQLCLYAATGEMATADLEAMRLARIEQRTALERMYTV